MKGVKLVPKQVFNPSVQSLINLKKQS